MTAPVVTLRDVTARRGGFTLEVPRWEVPAGAVMGVIGDNGSGKTTLLRLLPGLDPANRGEVRVLGRDPWREPVAVREQVGWVSPASPVFEARLDRLLWHVSGLYPTWDEALARDLITRFDLDLRATPATLSVGHQVRLRLVLALAFRPKLVVLDEPTTGLDVWARHALFAWLRDRAAGAEQSVVLASHDLHDVQRLCSHLTWVRGGRIAREGPMAEVVPVGQTIEDVVVAAGRGGS